MFRSRSWFFNSSSNSLWKPKNPHSVEYLKYLHGVLTKNATVTDQNKSLLVEALRSIAEILIWGDQNDPGVFEYFLEKNMLAFFLKIMRQNCGSYVCVQLLQTLSIVFENLKNQTSVYYLLSNNHVNSIIEHKFDFGDEELMAYYISFLKTLSLKLNSQTIHFFYNETTRTFPLYTEAIKFFNHPESMVRIAVRTLTLNVFRVEDKSMLEFIRDKTAAPYFSNLVNFISNHVLQIDKAIIGSGHDDDKHRSHLLDDLVAEHLDHLHYLNDIMLLGIEHLNHVLVDNLLNLLLRPLYIQSLTTGNVLTPTKDNDQTSDGKKTKISSHLALYFLSQIYMVMSQKHLLTSLTTLMFSSVTKEQFSSFLVIETNDHLAFFAIAMMCAISRSPIQNPFANLFTNEYLDILRRAVNDNYVRIVTVNLVTILLEIEVDTAALTTTTTAPTTMEDDLNSTEKEASSSSKDVSSSTQLSSSIDYIKSVITKALNLYLKNDEFFLDIFEDEYLKKFSNLETMLSDACMLLPVVNTPLSNVSLERRLPCGETEKCRRAMRVYFLLRKLSLKLRGEEERVLPLSVTKIVLNSLIDLTNSDLLSCTVHLDNVKLRRFLVVDSSTFILVEPSNRMGFGIVTFVAPLQDLQVLSDGADSRALHLTVSANGAKKPLLQSKFVFDDGIRCLAARQRLIKGRQRARERKLLMIKNILMDNNLKFSPPQQLRTRARYQPLAPQLPGLAVPSTSSLRQHHSTSSSSMRHSGGTPRHIPTSVRQDSETSFTNSIFDV